MGLRHCYRRMNSNNTGLRCFGVHGADRQKTHLKSCLFDTSGNVIAGTECATLNQIGHELPASDAPSST